MVKKSKSPIPRTGIRTQQSPAKINPALERLDILAGEWDVEFSSMSFLPDPSAVAHGRASFEWLEGGAFMIERSEAFDAEAPRGTMIIGPDDAAETYGMLYFDSRGVSRIYQMSLSDRTWKIWRDFPDFSQRFIGTFNEDGNIITARWEKSSDGSNWEHDFNLLYTRAE